MDQSNLISVKTELVLETLVGAISGEVEDRVSAGHRPRSPLPGSGPVPSFGDDPEVVAAVVLRGYSARAAELEMFEPARAEAPGLRETLSELLLEGAAAKDDAARAHAHQIALTEPLHRPAPGEGAFIWLVPGPGGHVRHYVALGAIAAAVRQPPEGFPELKRPWVYGFALRCCEQSLP